jgi:hypothetical protein
MLTQFHVVRMCRRPKAREDDWDSATNWLGSVQSSFGGQKEPFDEIWISLGIRFPGNNSCAI